jgi:hypothetical protein
MRQIHLCAWLLVMSLTAAACSGEKFTTSDAGSADNSGASANDGYTPPNRNEAAASGDEDDGNAGLSSGGKSLASGGTASTAGGASSSAGTFATSGGDASGVSEDCAMGSIKLKMIPSPDLPHDYLCDAGCGTGWLTITDGQGAAAYSLFPGCGSTNCESCSALPCAAAACLPKPLTAEGNELTWGGTYMTDGTCGKNQACQRPACIAPGKYKAKACAAINGGSNDTAGGSCTPKNVQLCAETEFEFPATTHVELVLKNQ